MPVPSIYDDWPEDDDELDEEEEPDDGPDDYVDDPSLDFAYDPGAFGEHMGGW
jgi:hypothetical protein